MPGPNERSKRTCLICDRDEDTPMVSCVRCNGRYHCGCVQITHVEAERDWYCDPCRTKKIDGTHEKSLLPELSGEHAGSVRSVSTKASSKKSQKIQAELEMVDEELAVIAEKNKLLVQREMLIQKRRSLLKQQNDTHSSSSSEFSTRGARCNEWVRCGNAASVSNIQNQNANDTMLEISDNIVHVAGAADEETAQIKQITDCSTRPPRVETGITSQWAPGVVPLSSTANVNSVVRDINVTPPEVNAATVHFASASTVNGTTVRLTSEHLAARKGLAKELPTFTGRPEEWPLFLATYEQTTQLCGFSDEENLIRLRHALDGAARNSVKSLLLNVSCVPQILSTLKMKFGRPELIIDILLKQIRDMPPPRESRLETIVDFAIEVQNVCATMKAASMTNYLNNPELQQELVGKLPGLLAAFWGMHKATLATSTLDDFSQWLFQLAQGANSVLIPSTSKSHRGNVNAHSNAASSQEVPPGKCLVCRGACDKVFLCDRFRQMRRSDKWKIIRKHNLCKICLLPHYPQPCSSGLKCNVANCNMDHNPLLHKMASPSGEVMTSVSVNYNAHHANNSNPILFRILPVTLFGNGVKISTFAFLDDGSSLSLIDEDIFKSLNINGEPQPLCMRWTSNMHRNEEDSILTNFEMTGADRKKRFLLKEVHTVKNLELPLQTIDVKSLQQQYRYLRDIPLASYENATPRLLIGLNNTRYSQCLKTKEGGENEPIAEKTRLGWVIKGTVSSGRPPANTVYYHSYSSCNGETKSVDELLDLVRNYIVNDNCIDMASDKKGNISLDDKLALQQLEEVTLRVGDHFETGLLWRGPETLPDGSFFAAKKRAISLYAKMEKDQNLYNALQLKMADYVSKGYARKLQSSEMKVDRCWYLPIFPVMNPNKPGKIRLVWDAAAKVEGISLNSMLLKGPDQLTSLVTVMRKFRQKSIAIGGDIAEMFHQVKMRKEDQQFQRFLWRDTSASRFETYIMAVMTFGASCSPCCAQYVKNKNAYDFQQQFPEAARCIIENHYVDDMLDSVDTEEEAIRLAKDVQFVHSQAGFHIRNWVSNSRKVLDALSATNIEQISFNIDGVCAAEKVLGMWWDTATDNFVYKISQRFKNSVLLSGVQRPTKREVLSLIMTIFDPLGLLGFYVVFAKVVFQETWRTGCAWDEEIGKEQFGKWVRWVRLLPEMETIKIQRCYTKLKSKNIIQHEIHTFVDASEEAYAAVSYLRSTDGYNVDVSLLGCKTKVAPIKTQSIPRLELQGAVVGARLARSLGKSLSLSVNKYFFWTDSSTVLSWLKSDHRRYKQFVAFRVSEVLDLSDLKSWRWLPTNENVADEATKWKRNPDFSQESRWFSGPSFLRLNETEWPKRNYANLDESEKELRACYVGHHHSQSNMASPLATITDQVSTWKRAVRVVGKVIQIVRKWKSLINKETVYCSELSQADIYEGENMLFKEAQKVFEEEVMLLLTKKPVPKSSSLYKLSPYLDTKGLVRLGGRAKLWNGVDPIILPRKHSVTNLIVNDFHLKYHHGNNETIVNEIRQRFWIPRLRTEVYKARRSCQMCRNRDANPNPPQMGNLHPARLAAFCRPFSYVGVDYFGPLMVAVRRSREKRYGVLVTCLTTRAIHLEIAYSLSTDSCIIAIRNFIARRGTPLEIWSDNGTNFKGTEREFAEAFSAVDKNEMIRAFTSASTKWKFIPPASPHMGGAWERLVRSVKNVLVSIIASRTPTDELLRAAFMEVEMTVNSRPLTYIPINPDVEEALTPNHFIFGSSNGSKPLIEAVADGVTLKKAWLTSQQLANTFWKRWVKEYLPIITRRSKWFDKVKPIAVDDVVYIVDPGNPRNCWPKGIVQAVHQGADGQVRSGTVKTLTGVYVRPATMIAVLEVKHSRDGVDPNEDIPGGSVK